jgi:hypothetical protein
VAPYRKLLVYSGIVVATLAALGVLAASFGILPPLVRNPLPIGHGTTSRVTSGHSVGPLGRRRVAVLGRDALPGADTQATFTTWLVFAALAAVLVAILRAVAVSERLRRRRAVRVRADWPPSVYRPEDWEDERHCEQP